MSAYIHDSESKQKVREKWVEYMQRIKGDEPLTIVTLPSSEIQELILFAEKGLIKAHLEEETGKFRIDEGNIYCFEKKQSRFAILFEKIVGGTTIRNDICAYIRETRPRALSNKKKIALPLDVLNLDFEASLDKLKIPLHETIDNVIACQAHHKKKFTIFITFPNTYDTDSEDYKNYLKNIIDTNLADQNNTDFINSYNEKREEGSLDDELNTIIALVKMIFKCSTNHHFVCNHSDIVVYGDKELGEGKRKRMISFLFEFDLCTENKSHTTLYYQDILRAFNEIEYL